MKCVTCKYYVMEPIDRGMICINSRSENCGDWTEPDDYCDQYEEDNDEGENKD